MLYVLLIGTVLSSFFGSIQSTMIRVMDPNEYDTLLTTLVADFNNVNVEVIAFSLVLLVALTIFLPIAKAAISITINVGIRNDKTY